MPVFLSPAKINWFLRVIGRRDNGYHNLQTLFQFLDLCDVLTINRRNDSHIKCSFEPEGSVDTTDNLVVRAARLLQRATNSRLGADIHVYKQIFTGGGLGGGSSNAATTLAALNALWRTQLSQAELQTLAGQLGADVAVFIYGQSCWAEGIGDSLTPLSPPECCHLIIHPGNGVDTATVFRSNKLRYSQPLAGPEAYHYEPFNDCEPAVKYAASHIARTLALIRTYNSNARLTGTGSCIIIPCENTDEAQQLKRHLSEHAAVMLTRGLNYSPLYHNFPHLRG